jgi:hypothetical protein
MRGASVAVLFGLIGSLALISAAIYFCSIFFATGDCGKFTKFSSFITSFKILCICSTSFTGTDFWTTEIVAG